MNKKGGKRPDRESESILAVGKFIGMERQNKRRYNRSYALCRERKNQKIRNQNTENQDIENQDTENIIM